MIAVMTYLSAKQNTYNVYVDGELLGYTTDDSLGFALEVAAHKINFRNEEEKTYVNVKT